MVAIVLLILLANLFAGSIESELREVFNDSGWMDGWRGVGGQDMRLDILLVNRADKGELTLRQTAEELFKAGWINFVDLDKTDRLLGVARLKIRCYGVI